MASGNCVMAAPDIFAQDEEGLVNLLHDTPDAKSLPRVEDAVRACPVAAITIADQA
jgi:ferredoxin